MFTFEGEAVAGQANVLAKINSMPQSKHVIDTIDYQPSKDNGDLFCCVVGKVQFVGSANPIHFSETFQLLSVNGTYVIYNDIFRAFC